MSFTLRPDRPLPDEVRRVVCTQIDLALRTLRDRSVPRGKRVHDARTCCKKVRAVLRLIGPCGDELYRRENAWFRNAARKLSAVRDAEVMVQSYAKLLQHAGPRAPRAAAARIQRHLHNHHRRLTSGGSGLAETLQEFAADMKAARKRVPKWRLGLSTDAIFTLGLGSAYRAARKAARRAGRHRDDEAWHEWRKRAKVYGYHLTLLRHARDELVKAMKREVDELTDQLGDEHDLAVLRATLCEKQKDWGEPDAVRTLVRLIDARRRELRQACRRIAAAIFVDKPADVSSRMLRWWQHAAKTE